jgi:putative membrane protein
MTRSQPWATALAVAAFSTTTAALAARVPHDEELFARKAAEAGMDEIAAGRIAEQRSGNDAVRQFAQRMVEDHGKAGAELHRVASSRGITLPEKLDKSAEQDLDRLTKLHGAAFDNAYMKHNVSAHKKAVKDFGNEARSGKDEALKRFAQQTLPTLKEHEQLAEATARAVGASGPPRK